MVWLTLIRASKRGPGPQSVKANLFLVLCRDYEWIINKTDHALARSKDQGDG